MEEGEVVLRVLVPANEPATKAMHPRRRALHHPAPRGAPRLRFAGLRCLSARADLGGTAELLQRGLHLIVVVAGIQAPPLRLVLGRLWPCDDQACDGRADQVQRMPIGPFYLQADRDAVPLRQQAAFAAGLAPVGGIVPGCFPRPVALA
jgi:hypothetical protein